MSPASAEDPGFKVIGKTTEEAARTNEDRPSM